MYSLNKFVWMFANPLALGLLILGFALAVKIVGVFGVKKDARKCSVNKVAWGMVVVSLLWFWIWGTKAWTQVVGYGLERDYLVQGPDGMCMKVVADYPEVDAIVDLGGGCGAKTNLYNGVLLNAAADRAYFSSQLWKGGKASIIIASGSDLELADKLFLRDLGVVEDAIVVENEAKNTEENAKLVAKILRDIVGYSDGEDRVKFKVLLVTSAWHMKRSMMMFDKYAPELECIPAACDFECSPSQDFQFGDLLPDTGVFECNCRYFHEWLGIWGYKYFRR